MRKRSCDQHPRWERGCDPCNRKSRNYEKRRQVALNRGQRLSVDAADTIRQIRELRAAGYRLKDLEAHSGLYHKHLHNLSANGGPTRRVQLKTQAAVRLMYDQLAPFPGPSNHARAWARRNGWRPPILDLADPVVDEVQVARALHGETVRLTIAERRAAVYHLHDRGATESAICRHLHISGARLKQILAQRGPHTRAC